MAEKMVQQDATNANNEINLNFQYSPSPPGEADDIMNAVLSGLVKTDQRNPVTQYDQRVSTAPMSMLETMSNFPTYQHYRRTPYPQPYYPNPKPISPPCYSTQPSHQPNRQPSIQSPMHSPMESSNQPRLQLPLQPSMQSSNQIRLQLQPCVRPSSLQPTNTTDYQMSFGSQQSIPTTVYQAQDCNSPDSDKMSDEQLDETLKDLGLLEPSPPKTSHQVTLASRQKVLSPHLTSLPSHLSSPTPTLTSPSGSKRPLLSPTCSSLSICKESQGQPRLYRFIMTLLESSETNPSLIEWVDKNKGMFALVDPNEIARRWGVCKNNSCMNYEKMSRGFRYYYKVGILERVPGKKLVYKFSARAPIWNMMSSTANEKRPSSGSMEFPKSC